MKEIIETKLAVVIREDLANWQKLNVTAFLASGIAATVNNVTGEPFEDASGVKYLPMFQQPILVFGASGEQMKKVYERAMRRNLRIGIYTNELFKCDYYIDCMANIKEAKSDDLDLAGMAMRDDRRIVDKILKGVRLHG